MKKTNNARNSMKYSAGFGTLALATVITAMLTGCAPISPSPHLSEPGTTGMLLFLLIAVAGYFLWSAQNYKLTAKPIGNRTESNDVNTRLEVLEKEIQIIKTQIKGDHHV